MPHPVSSSLPPNTVENAILNEEQRTPSGTDHWSHGEFFEGQRHWKISLPVPSIEVEYKMSPAGLILATCFRELLKQFFATGLHGRGAGRGKLLNVPLHFRQELRAADRNVS